MKFSGLTVLTCAAVLTLACADGRDDATTTTTTAERQADGVGTTGTFPAANREAQEFVNQAAIAEMAEVQLGKLAVERAQNPEVRQFGEMMVRDHTKANQALKEMMAAYGITPATQLDDEHQDLVTRLQELRGAEFDREYISAMVDGHEEMLSMLEDRIEAGQEATDQGAAAGIRQWAQQTRPTVEQHLKTAQQIQDKLEGDVTASR